MCAMLLSQDYNGVESFSDVELVVFKHSNTIMYSTEYLKIIITPCCWFPYLLYYTQECMP
jgi:hypothetical protein